MLRKASCTLAAAALATTLTAAVKPDPVQWSALAASRRADGAVVLTVGASIETGWFIYSMRQPGDGPAPLRFRVSSGGTVGTVSAPAPRIAYDPGFRARVGKYYGAPVFTVPVRGARDSAPLQLEIRYQACNATICLPPRTKTVQARVTPTRS